jgi:hypothetical protein
VADPFFGPAFIDADMWRDLPTRHRYVHGGFQGTDTRFAFYLPEPRWYDGRFIQLLEGGLGGHEGDALHSEAMIGPSVEWLARKFGAYLVESNQGHIGLDPGPADPTIVTYRASAESARYARELASEMYGWAPHHGYLLGPSGGGIRTWQCMEHVYDVWDGGVPFVAGDPEAASGPDAGPLAAAVAGLLGPKLADVVDALEPGGGDPFAGLDDVERESLRALFERTGFPRRGLFQHTRPSSDLALAPLFVAGLADSDFVADFWSVAGYAGADGELADRLVDDKLVITEVLSVDQLNRLGITDHAAGHAAARSSGEAGTTAFEYVWVGVRTAPPLPLDTQFASVQIETGASAGQQLTCYGTFGDVAVVGGSGAYHANALAEGDKVRLNNRSYLAACHRHRYPERRPLELHLGSARVENLPMCGRFHGKMIMVNAALDGLATPRNGITYDRKVRATYGTAADSRWRLWWADNSGHTGTAGQPGPRPVMQTRVINYRGMVSQALSDLVDWVERGVEPPPSTAYEFADGQLRLPPSAAARAGIQPVVAVTANGGKRAEVAAGEEVIFTVSAEAPPGGGVIVRVEWDFDGAGLFATREADVGSPQTVLRATTTHRFAQPGTYFPAVRVVAQRPDSEDWSGVPEFAKTPLLPAGFENLDRVRVVVT